MKAIAGKTTQRKMLGELLDLCEELGIILMDCQNAELTREQVIAKTRAAFDLIDNKLQKFDPATAQKLFWDYQSDESPDPPEPKAKGRPARSRRTLHEQTQS